VVASPDVARLILRQDPGRAEPLDPRRPLAIGRDPANGFCLPEAPSLSRRHAEIHHDAAAGGWRIRDLGSANGTFVGRERVGKAGRLLADGDAIRLGRRGPELLFQLEAEPATVAPPAAQQSAVVPAPAERHVEIGGEKVPLERIRSVTLRSRPRHPHMFSWWVLVSLAGLLLLPFPLLFWPLQAGALAVVLVFGLRREHTLVVVLQDGRARRRRFANRLTALSHCNGLRRAIGQSPEQ
jgi:hypothetical protein